MLSILDDGARELGVELSKKQLDQFQRFYDLLIEWAQRVSLTGVKDEEGVQRRHYLETVAILPILQDEELSLEGASLVDVGSGSGIPGVPLKILVPDLELTLIEAKQRKVEFLTSVLPEIGLEDVTVITKRAEEAGRDPRYRDQYDFAVAKALAPLRTLLELTLPFLRMGGTVVAPKGKGADKEVAEADNALRTLNASIRAVEPIPLAQPAQTLILATKDLPTPDRFPRRPGMPAKRPL